MHAKLFFNGTPGSPISYTDMFDDMIDVICGETDFANLSVASAGSGGHIVSSVAAGWTLKSRDDTTTSGVIYYIVSAPVSGASTKLKYVLFRCNTSTGQFYWTWADAVNNGGASTVALYHTKSAHVFTSTNGSNNYIYNNASHYLYLSVTPQCIGIFPGYSSATATFIFEYEYDQGNFRRTIGKDEDFCPICSYKGTAFATSGAGPAGQPPIPSPYTDDTSAYFIANPTDGEEYSNGNIKAFLSVNGWWTTDLLPIAPSQNDASTPYVFHRPWVGSGKVVLGYMHSNVPWYRVDSQGIPSNVQGDEVSITPTGGGSARVFTVWSTQWGTSTTTPLYVEKI